jgi:hypothetical protein
MENSDLINIAVKARALAYAPYSKFAVGAAVAMKSTKPAAPCTPSLNPNMKVFAATLGGNVQEFDLAEPLPLPGHGVLEGTSRV